MWLVLQAVPSVGMITHQRDVGLALEWQLTPLLWSHAMDPRLSPWRSFIVEPIVRHAGSLELFVAPHYWSLPALSTAAGRVGGKLGLRSTMPLLHRGEYLSCSLGSVYVWRPGDPGVSFEAGLYTLFGFVGLTVGAQLLRSDPSWQTLLKLRVF
jgi:hypothetical protein